jgi:hypothetical protein
MRKISILVCLNYRSYSYTRTKKIEFYSQVLGVNSNCTSILYSLLPFISWFSEKGAKARAIRVIINTVGRLATFAKS